MPYLATAVVLLLALAAIGAAMMPGWLGTTPYTDHIAVASTSTATKARDFAGTPEGTYQVQTSTTRVALTKSVSVDAIIRTPIEAPAGRPACLFIHGAGTGKASEVYADLASSMASAGIVTLVPSKRMDTYSTLRRNYYDMAHDYEASLNVLRHQPGVDASKTGLYAESEGTWISEAMALIDPHISFMVLTSPPAVSGRHQMAMAANSYMALCGAPQGLHRDVDKVLSMDFAPLGPDYADFPAEQYFSRLTMPLLVNYGTDDPSMPIEQGARLIEAETRKAGNANTTFRYYNANHQMRQGAKTSKPGLPLDPNYTKNLDYWVQAATMNQATATTSTYSGWTSPHIAGAQPKQQFAAPLRTPSGIVGSLTVLVAGIAATMICFVLAAVLALAAKLTSRHQQQQQSLPSRGNSPSRAHPHRRLPRSLTVLMTVCSVSLLATVIAFFVYVAIALIGALSLSANPNVLQNGWVLLRIISLVDVIVCTAMIVKLVRAQTSPQTASWGLCRSMAMILTAAGSLIALLLLAFFGMYGI